ncbi:MAG: heat-inducible transcription repressor HrcA [Clostridia bacterium]|nr:heat-inducible transcription repressor HrcA [Clostridia bacterium]
MELDERKFMILRAIVDDYIMTAMPVGSRTLSRKSEIGLSSATIRNEMSDLEELGYLDQPHTSAGRVPSAKAFRLYVDQLMRVASLGKQESEYIRASLTRRSNMLDDVLQSAVQILSEVTGYAAAATGPMAAKLTFEHVQLVPITSTTALVVLVTNAAVFKDTIIHVPQGVTPEMLSHISARLSQRLKGRPIHELSDAALEISEDIASHRELGHELIQAIATAQERSHNKDIVFGGRANLLNQPEYSADIDRVRSLITALEPRGALATMLPGKANLEFSISIGPELGSQELQDVSLVTVSYHMGDQKVGTMGIIGPMRMDYARVAAVLMQMRSTLNDMFNQN